MKWLANVFAGGVDKVISSIGDAIDKNVTTDEERAAMKNELKRIETAALASAQENELRLQEEITKRHAYDMQSDDRLSKRIRPIALIYLLITCSILSVTDGNIVFGEYTFTVKGAWVDLFKVLLVTAFSFYFGSRGLEKLAKIVLHERRTNKSARKKDLLGF